MHAEIFAGAAPAEFRAGFHFVENQQRAVFVADLAQAFQEAGLRHAEADVHQNRFENDRGNLAGIFFEAALDRGEIVERGNHNVGDRRFRHAQTAGDRCWIVDVAIVGSVRLHADQSAVMQAVVGAFELDDLVASGSGASQANRVHGGFGAAVAEAAHLDRKAVADFFREFPLHVVRHAEHGAGGEALLDGLHHRRMAMSGHERAEGQVVVDVFVAVEVAKLAAAGLFHEDRPGIVGAIVAGYAERNAFEILLVGFGGFGRAPLESGEFFLQIGIHRIAPGRLRPAAFPVGQRAIRLPGGGAARVRDCLLFYSFQLEVKLQSKLHSAADRAPAGPGRRSCR